jgi:hypothetical protein
VFAAVKALADPQEPIDFIFEGSASLERSVQRFQWLAALSGDHAYRQTIMQRHSRRHTPGNEGFENRAEN